MEWKDSDSSTKVVLIEYTDRQQIIPANMCQYAYLINRKLIRTLSVSSDSICFADWPKDWKVKAVLIAFTWTPLVGVIIKRQYWEKGAKSTFDILTIILCGGRL